MLPGLNICKNYYTWVLLLTCFPHAREVLLQQQQLLCNIWSSHVGDNGPMCRIINLDLCPVVSFATGPMCTWESFSALWCLCSWSVKWSSSLGGVVSSCSTAKIVRQQKWESRAFAVVGLYIRELSPAWFCTERYWGTMHYMPSFCQRLLQMDQTRYNSTNLALFLN